MVKSKFEIIKDITEIRAGNNLLWMKIVTIALEVAPKKTKTVLRGITKNDRKISRRLAKL